MAWTPNPNEPVANFEEPILDNTLAIIVRDFKEALDFYYPAEDYEDFNERGIGQMLGNAYPSLALMVRTNATEEADDRSHVVEAARIAIFIAVTDSGPTAVTKKVMRYVRTMNGILRSARNDFFEGMNNPFGVSLAISHDYGPPANNKEKTAFFRVAVLELTISLRER